MEDTEGYECKEIVGENYRTRCPSCDAKLDFTKIINLWKKDLAEAKEKIQSLKAN